MSMFGGAYYSTKLTLRLEPSGLVSKLQPNNFPPIKPGVSVDSVDLRECETQVLQLIPTRNIDRFEPMDDSETSQTSGQRPLFQPSELFVQPPVDIAPLSFEVSFRWRLRPSRQDLRPQELLVEAIYNLKADQVAELRPLLDECLDPADSSNLHPVIPCIEDAPRRISGCRGRRPLHGPKVRCGI